MGRARKGTGLAGSERYSSNATSGRAVDVFLVPQAVDQHHGRFQRPRRQQLVHGLVAPEGVVARMFGELPPEAQLIETPSAAQLAGRTSLHEHVVIVVVARPPLRF